MHMQNISLSKLMELYVDTLQHCGTHLLEMSDEDIGYYIFEEFDGFLLKGSRPTRPYTSVFCSDEQHVGKYSLGMKQRLGIAQAIMEGPELLILDEPFNGLDKHGVAEMRVLIKGLRDVFAGNKKMYLVPPLSNEEMQGIIDFLLAGEGLTEIQQHNSGNIIQTFLGHIEESTVFPDKEYVKVAFGLPTQPDSVYIYGENARDTRLDPAVDKPLYFDALIDTGETGIGSRITARTHDNAAGTFSSFVYTRGILQHSVEVTKAMGGAQAYLDTAVDAAAAIDSKWGNLFPSDSEWRMQEQSRIEGLKEIALDTNVTESAARIAAEQLFVKMGVKDMIFADCEPSVQFLTDQYYKTKFDNRNIDLNTAKGGLLLTYYRGSGGIASCRLTNGLVTAGEWTMERLPFAPPFYAEYVTVFVTEEGIQHFGWYNIGMPVAVIAENTNIISFEEASRKMADYVRMAYQGIESGKYLFSMNYCGLRYAYQTAYENPENAWLVPVWVFDAMTIRVTPDDDLIRLWPLQMQFSALDGLPIVPEQYQLRVEVR